MVVRRVQTSSAARVQTVRTSPPTVSSPSRFSGVDGTRSIFFRLNSPVDEHSGGSWMDEACIVSTRRETTWYFPAVLHSQYATWPRKTGGRECLASFAIGP